MTTLFAVLGFLVGFGLIWLFVMKPARERWKAIQARKTAPDGDTSGGTPGETTSESNLNT